MIGGFGSFDGFEVDPFGGADGLRQEIADQILADAQEATEDATTDATYAVVITTMGDRSLAPPPTES